MRALTRVFLLCFSVALVYGYATTKGLSNQYLSVVAGQYELLNKPFQEKWERIRGDFPSWEDFYVEAELHNNIRKVQLRADLNSGKISRRDYLISSENLREGGELSYARYLIYAELKSILDSFGQLDTMGNLALVETEPGGFKDVYNTALFGMKLIEAKKHPSSDNNKKAMEIAVHYWKWEVPLVYTKAEMIAMACLFTLPWILYTPLLFGSKKSARKPKRKVEPTISASKS